MKLFRLTIDNNLEYSDHNWDTKLIVANSQREAEIRAESWMQEEYRKGYHQPSFFVEEISEVDGFKISVS